MHHHEICERWIIIWHMRTDGKKGANDWTQRFRWGSLLSHHCESYCNLKLECCSSCSSCKRIYSIQDIHFRSKFFHTLILSLPLWTYDIDPFYCWLLLSSSPPLPLSHIVVPAVTVAMANSTLSFPLLRFYQHQFHTYKIAYTHTIYIIIGFVR